MRVNTSHIDSNKIRLTVVVGEEELNEAQEATATKLSRQIAVKGFRKGKVPRAVLVAHLGGPAILRAETIRESMPDFYAKAVSRSKVDPISQPEITVTDGEESGELAFEADIEIRPEVAVHGYGNLQVTIPSPVVSDSDVDDVMNRYLETDAELRDVTRNIQINDLVTMDVRVEPVPNEEGREALNLTDYMYTVGSGTLTAGLDESIVGMQAGEHLKLEGPMPGGLIGAFDLDLKAVKEKVLPELSDEWVQENTDWSTIDAMRSSILEQLRQRKVVEAQLSQRDAIALALAQLVPIESAPAVLVDAETQDRLHDLGHRLGDQGANLEMFLQMTNQTPQQLLESLREDALRAVRTDLALRAIVKAESLFPSEAEVQEELVRTAESMNIDPTTLGKNLEESGRAGAFEAEVAKMKANKWLAERVVFVDEQGVKIDKELLKGDQSSEDNA